MIFAASVKSLGQPGRLDWISAPDGHRIPVRRFAGDRARRPVVMLHGLQSHSAWFVGCGHRIAEVGLPVHAFDRAGSGVSREDIEVGPRLEGLLAEVDAVVEDALAGTTHDSVHVLGHCFGALVALLYASLHRPARVASLVLATPALYTLADLSLREKARVLWSVIKRQPLRVPAPLSPGDFSEVESFVEFVRADPLALRTVPARLHYEIGRARLQLPHAAAALRAPLLVALAGDDRICDNRRNRRLLERVTAPKDICEYAGARHILEFSRQRDIFLDDLAAWYLEREQV